MTLIKKIRVDSTEDKQSAELDLEYGRKDRVSIHMETGESYEMISDVVNSNARNISEDLHYTQVSSRSNNRAVISLIESSHHGKASEVYEVDSGIISNINIFAFDHC